MKTQSMTVITVTETELNRLVERVRVLEEAIKYAPHNFSCPAAHSFDADDKCTCWIRSVLEGK